MAGFLELGVAVGADGPGFFNVSPAARAEWAFFNGMQQGFLFKRLLVFFVQGARGAQDQVDHNARQEEQRYNDNCQEADERVAGTAADVAISPDDQADPEGCQESSSPGSQAEQDVVDG